MIYLVGFVLNVIFRRYLYYTMFPRDPISLQYLISVVDIFCSVSCFFFWFYIKWTKIALRATSSLIAKLMESGLEENYSFAKEGFYSENDMKDFSFSVS